VDENGFCLGQKRVDEKSNEIMAIPDLLDDLNIKGHIITTDAMGTQKEIVKRIRQRRADYFHPSVSPCPSCVCRAPSNLSTDTLFCFVL
jgi:predicted transposase YbfD/YdcC